MQLVHGTVQHYAWGDPDLLPTMLGTAPDGRPWAEVWFGTHPAAPSRLDDGRELSTLTGELPFLVKLLAAREPLSLQTHPDAATARAGFDREEAAGLALDDPRRIYRDPNAKPELICALSRFEALCGFRPEQQSQRWLTGIGATSLAALLADLGLAATVEALYRHHDDARKALDELVAACRDRSASDAHAAAIADLAGRYPGDASVGVAALLHHVVLAPGEGLYLDAGNLHAYLSGLGVEVMGASDNVVRGGLTTKHVDVDELLAVVRIAPIDDPVVRPAPNPSGCLDYATPSAPFHVARIDLNSSPVDLAADGVEVLLCVDGDAGVLHRGQAAALVARERTRLHGRSTVFRVTAAR